MHLGGSTLKLKITMWSQITLEVTEHGMGWQAPFCMPTSAPLHVLTSSWSVSCSVHFLINFCILTV